MLGSVYSPYRRWLLVIWFGFFVLFVKWVFLASFSVAESLEKSFSVFRNVTRWMAGFPVQWAFAE